MSEYKEDATNLIEAVGHELGPTYFTPAQPVISPAIKNIDAALIKRDFIIPPFMNKALTNLLPRRNLQGFGEINWQDEVYLQF